MWLYCLLYKCVWLYCLQYKDMWLYCLLYKRVIVLFTVWTYVIVLYSISERFYCLQYKHVIAPFTRVCTVYSIRVWLHCLKYIHVWLYCLPCIHVCVRFTVLVHAHTGGLIGPFLSGRVTAFISFADSKGAFAVMLCNCCIFERWRKSQNVLWMFNHHLNTVVPAATSTC